MWKGMLGRIGWGNMNQKNKIVSVLEEWVPVFSK